MARLALALVLIFSAIPVHAVETWTITDDRRQKIGSLYDPGHGRRIQVRDDRGRIVGYVEKVSDVTDRRRRKVGQIEQLLDGP